MRIENIDFEEVALSAGGITYLPSPSGRGWHVVPGEGFKRKPSGANAPPPLVREAFFVPLSTIHSFNLSTKLPHHSSLFAFHYKKGWIASLTLAMTSLLYKGTTPLPLGEGVRRTGEG